jgi:hypothetical protein
MEIHDGQSAPGTGGGSADARRSFRVSEDIAATLIGLALLALILLGALPKGILP